MKKIFIMFFSVLLLAGCSDKKVKDGEFIIIGKFSKIKGPMLVLLDYTDDENRSQKQEFISKNGEFTFTGKKTTASRAYILFAPYSEKYTKEQPEYWEFFAKEMAAKKYLMGDRTFFLEAGTFEFTGEQDLKTAELKTQGKNQELFASYNKELQVLNSKFGEAIHKKEIADSIGVVDANTDKIDRNLKSAKDKLYSFSRDFAAKHPQSKVSLVALRGDGANYDIDRLSQGLDLISKELQATEIAKMLRKVVANAQNSEIGRPAVDFSLKDPKGERKSLSAYKGKFVLIDFWASWCGPCRAENPNVLKAYNTFKDQNFDIISISVDAKKDAWLKAVKEDKLPWLNLIDEDWYGPSIARAYGALVVPSNFLVDPSGKIVAKDLKGKELHTKLAEFLKK